MSDKMKGFTLDEIDDIYQDVVYVGDDRFWKWWEDKHDDYLGRDKFTAVENVQERGGPTLEEVAEWVNGDPKIQKEMRRRLDDEFDSEFEEWLDEDFDSLDSSAKRRNIMSGLDLSGSAKSAIGELEDLFGTKRKGNVVFYNEYQYTPIPQSVREAVKAVKADYPDLSFEIGLYSVKVSDRKVPLQSQLKKKA